MGTATRPTAASARRAETKSAFPRSDRVWPALLGFAPVAALSAAQGGYFPTSWGWTSLGLVLVAGVALAVRTQLRLSVPELAFVAAWCALAVWIGLSALWSINVPQTVLEVERTLVYVVGCAALAVIGAGRDVRYLLGGLLCAIGAVSLFSLATRLVPDHVRVSDSTATYRLAQPIGYWNGLSIFTVIGVLLALGFAARGRSTLVRAAAAALLVPLLVTFYFTFGRTGWLALAAGVCAALLFDRRRVQLLALMLPLGAIGGVAVWGSAQYSALTHVQSTRAAAASAGHALAVRLLGLVVLAAAASAAFAVVERRLPVRPAVRVGFVAAVLAAAVIGGAATVAAYGGPVALSHKSWHAFKAPPPHPVDLNDRLLSFSGNGRYDLWRVAWSDAKAHPWLGSGAGSYERYFLRHKPTTVSRVRDAHGLYVETLAELGPLGLALLAAALLLPLAVAVRRGASPLAGAAAGAYVAYLVHAASDWDWELPAVTLAALVCGGALVIGRREAGGRRRVLGTRARVGALVAVVAVGAFASMGLAGNSALGASRSARHAADWTGAAAEARRARTWMPWSPRPWAALGTAQLGAGRVGDARWSFEKAVAIDPGDWTLWADLATASTGAARRRALEHVVALYPTSPLRRRLEESSFGEP
jgi:hypothetical protein